MRDFTIAFILVAILTTVSTNSVERTHPDVGLDVFQLAEKHGYPMEQHEVETEDGYILGLHRIPHGKENQHLSNKPSVLLMHGFISCSADWINVGPGKSLAYMLADLGYDVWLGNARGNANSRKHKTLDPDTDKAKFWSFSWNEIGHYDLPANIDYILALTGAEQLQYVGFSQGTTSFFVMASTRPEYNQKIKLATTLAPVAEMTYLKNPFMRPIAPFESILYTLAKVVGIYEIVPRSEAFQKLTLHLCDDGKPTQELCKLVLFAIAGYNREQLDGGFIPVITSNTPAGANLKQLIHYAQLVNSKKFQQFDYHDEIVNMEKYGSAEPPKYDLSLITAPVAIYYGENDWLASDTDTENLSKVIPNVVLTKLIDDKAFTHIDFAWSIDIDTLLNNDVVQLMELYK